MLHYREGFYRREKQGIEILPKVQDCKERKDCLIGSDNRLVDSVVAITKNS